MKLLVMLFGGLKSVFEFMNFLTEFGLGVDFSCWEIGTVGVVGGEGRRFVPVFLAAGVPTHTNLRIIIV